MKNLKKLIDFEVNQLSAKIFTTIIGGADKEPPVKDIKTTQASSDGGGVWPPLIPNSPKG